MVKKVDKEFRMSDQSSGSWQPVVAWQWLQQNFRDSRLVVLDSTIAKMGEVGPHRFAEVQIPGARFFDIDGVFSDHDSGLPHTLPSPEAFTAACQALGIHQDSKIVIYDHHGVYSSPRAWWMFQAMGHHDVAVLDGGLPKWIDAGMATEVKRTTPERTTTEHKTTRHESTNPIRGNLADANVAVGDLSGMEAPSGQAWALGDFQAQLQPDLVCNAEQVLQSLQQSQTVVLDARSAGRFQGTSPEPRPGMKSGHIPGSINLPFDHVVRDGQFLPKAELLDLLQGLGLDDQRLVFSCGSGITACVILLACELVLPNSKAVYDGSWAQWGQPEQDFPVVGADS